MTSYKPPKSPHVSAPSGARQSTIFGMGFAGAIHHAYKTGVPDEVIKDLWTNGLEAMRLISVCEATAGALHRVRPGMDGQQALRNLLGDAAARAEAKTDTFLMICEAMLPSEKKP